MTTNGVETLDITAAVTINVAPQEWRKVIEFIDLGPIERHILRGTPHAQIQEAFAKAMGKFESRLDELVKDLMAETLGDILYGDTDDGTPTS